MSTSDRLTSDDATVADGTDGLPTEVDLTSMFPALPWVTVSTQILRRREDQQVGEGQFPLILDVAPGGSQPLARRAPQSGLGVGDLPLGGPAAGVPARPGDLDERERHGLVEPEGRAKVSTWDVEGPGVREERDTSAGPTRIQLTPPEQAVRRDPPQAEVTASRERRQRRWWNRFIRF